VSGPARLAGFAQMFHADATWQHFSVDGDRVRTVDQYVGDPAAVAAFWA